MRFLLGRLLRFLGWPAKGAGPKAVEPVNKAHQKLKNK